MGARHDIIMHTFAEIKRAACVYNNYYANAVIIGGATSLVKGVISKVAESCGMSPEANTNTTAAEMRRL